MAEARMYIKKYSGPAIAIHWLMALFIFAALGMGIYMSDLPFSMMRIKLFNWHKWIGVTVLMLAILRMIWRIGHKPPPLPASVAGWQRGASHATHWIMYALIFIIPLLGWAHSSASGYPVVYLGLVPFPDWVGKNKELAETLGQLHGLAAFVLLFIIVLHILAALKHALIDKDGVLSRMLPGRAN